MPINTVLDSVEKNPSWETYGLLGGQEIPHVLFNP